jgi:hypothetical protein
VVNNAKIDGQFNRTNHGQRKPSARRASFGLLFRGLGSLIRVEPFKLPNISPDDERSATSSS